MKRLLLIILLVVSTNLCILAEEESVNTFDDIGVSIGTISGCDTYTRNIKESDPLLRKLGFTKSQFVEYLETSNIYYGALADDGSYEIILVAVENDPTLGIDDLRDYSEADLIEQITDIEVEYEGLGFQNVEGSYFQSDTLFFYNVEFTQQQLGKSIPTYQSYTIINGKTISIILQSYDGVIDLAMKLQQKKLVDSMKALNSATGNVNYYDGDTWAIEFILGLIYAFLIYSLPIVIYRYAVKKEPVSKGTAIGITLVYGFIALCIVVIIGNASGDPSPGGAVVLWSMVNYYVLTNKNSTYVKKEKVGKMNSALKANVDNNSPVILTNETVQDNDVEDDFDEIQEPVQNTLGTDIFDNNAIDTDPVIDGETDSIVEIEIEENNLIDEEISFNYCHKCGSKLLEESTFCSSCGARIH